MLTLKSTRATQLFNCQSAVSDSGEGQNAQFDKQTLNRLQQIENLDSDIKEKMWFFIDAILRDSQARKAYAS